MRKDQHYIALKFFGFTNSIADISGMLQLQPTKSFLKGEEYASGLSTRQTTRVRKDNAWIFEWMRETEQWTQVIADEFLAQIIAPKKDVIKAIAETCYCEFSVVQYVYDGCNPGFHFTKESLGLIHFIGAELDIDVYCLAGVD
jgi:hypothetical protein